MERFTARIHKVGINPCVDVPARISKAYGRRGYVPVNVTLGGEIFRATLVPVGGGSHRLCLHHLMRKAAGRETGDMITIRLALDTASRVLKPPADLVKALRAAGQMKTFVGNTPSRRKELVRWVQGTKNPKTRARRVAQVVRHFTHPGSWAVYR